jgi:hypothetical protein
MHDCAFFGLLHRASDENRQRGTRRGEKSLIALRNPARPAVINLAINRAAARERKQSESDRFWAANDTEWSDAGRA